MSTENQTPQEDVEITNPQGTEETENTVKNPITPAEEEIDYKTKFSESTREAQRLLDEMKSRDAEIERLKKLAESGTSYSDNSETLYPGFEQLDPQEQQNLIAYTNSIRDRVKNDVYSDPAIAFAKQSYNERRWSEAFENAATKYPELRENKEDFKRKYFKADVVPENIGDILEDLSKVYLFDKAKDLGAQEALANESRIDIERSKGGDKTPTASRSLEDWSKIAENPAKFAQMSKEYKADLESGKLK